MFIDFSSTLWSDVDLTLSLASRTRIKSSILAFHGKLKEEETERLHQKVGQWSFLNVAI